MHCTHTYMNRTCIQRHKFCDIFILLLIKCAQRYEARQNTQYCYTTERTCWLSQYARSKIIYCLLKKLTIFWRKWFMILVLWKVMVHHWVRDSPHFIQTRSKRDAFATNLDPVNTMLICCFATSRTTYPAMQCNIPKTRILYFTTSKTTKLTQKWLTLFKKKVLSLSNAPVHYGKASKHDANNLINHQTVQKFWTAEFVVRSTEFLNSL